MSIEERVIDSIAETTRYPKELLTTNADLEVDLGIDSVKRAEITLALGEAFGLDLMEEERDPNVRTIGDVAKWIEGFLANQSTPSPQPNNVAPHLPATMPPPPMGRMNNAPPSQPLSTGGVNGFSYSQPNPTSPYAGGAPYTNGAPAPVETAPIAAGGKSFQGRVALVTGSGRSIGRTIARMLASRGATVVVNSFHSRDGGEQTVRDIIQSGGNAIHAWGSVANPEHVNLIFNQIQEQFGYLDMLVCNASDGRIGSFSDIGPDDWDRAFRTNVSGHYQCAMRAAPLMQTRGGGSIVTMSALGAHHFVDGLGSQGVVKAAVETLTKYLACELAKYRVRANCVAGGPVYGDLLDKFPDAEARQHLWESLSPGGELTSPLDLARTIAFLLSDEAKGINGAVWQVDQGFSATTVGHNAQAGQASQAAPNGTRQPQGVS